MNEIKKFKTLGESKAWAQTNQLTWYTNYWKSCNYNPIDGLKAKVGDDVKYAITEVGETRQIFYKDKERTKNDWLHKKRE